MTSCKSHMKRSANTAHCARLERKHIHDILPHLMKHTSVCLYEAHDNIGFAGVSALFLCVFSTEFFVPRTR